MTEKELKKLSRMDLLKLLIEQATEMELLKVSLQEKEQELAKREITIQNCGSIAEASLRLTNIFAEADKACESYIENVKRVSVCQEELLKETEKKCLKMKEEAKIECAEMIRKAKALHL